MTDSPLGVDAAPHDVYRGLLREKVLGFQACEACSAVVFPPRSRCPQCGAPALGWRRSQGRGTVYATTSVAPRDASPYAVVLVDFDEGFRMMSRLDDLAAHPLAIDDRVRVDFVEVDGATQPFVVPTGDRA